MIDFSRRRFLFDLAAAPLVVPQVKHFVLPRFSLRTPAYAGDGFHLTVEGSRELARTITKMRLEYEAHGISFYGPILIKPIPVGDPRWAQWQAFNEFVTRSRPTVAA